ncbi:MAG: hypothetical protein RL205_1703 [Actinomycetota bacterium]
MMEPEQVAETLWDRWSQSSARAPRIPEAATVSADPEAEATPLTYGADPDYVDEVAGLHIAETTGSRPLVWLTETHAQVTPGHTVRLKVNIRNVGTVVETYNISILGPANSWVTPIPNEISLFPGDEGSATLMIRPTKTSTLTAGRYVVGVKATSQVQWTERTVAEFTVDVEPYHTFRALFARSTLDMRRRAQTYVQVSNDGNSSVDFNLAVIDPDGRIKVKCEKEDFTLRPGEPTWINVTVKGHVKWFGRPKTGNLVATVTPLRDSVLGTEITEMKPSIQHATVVQKPIFHLRLGFFGRMAILFTILALLATFLFTRWQASQAPTVTGAPATPSSLRAAMDGGNVVLTWDPASGATGYSIYAVGAAGNPPASPSPAASSAAGASPAASASPSTSASPASPTSAAPTPAATTAPSASASPVADTTTQTAVRVGKNTTEFTPAGASAGITFRNVSTGKKKSRAQHGEKNSIPGIAITDVAVVAGGEPTGSPSPSPKPSSSSTAKSSASATPSSKSGSPSPSDTDSSRDPYASPSALATFPSGTPVPSSSTSDLKSPICTDCTYVDAVPAGATRYVVKSPPTGINACYRISATAGTNESLFSIPACVEVPGAEDAASEQAAAADGSPPPLPPCKPVSKKAKATGETSIALTWKAPTKATTDSSTGEDTCDITLQITGWEIQKQILSGWADISPQPAANDTAIEVSGLTSGTKYCFRMRSVTASAKSNYTGSFCATTVAPPVQDPAPNSTPTASASPTPTPSTSPKVIVLAP